MSLLRHLLFVGLVGGGVAALGVNLVPPREPVYLTEYHTAPAPDFAAAVERVNAAFRDRWTADNVTATTPASDLAVARRVALGLMGTVPSLEELRQFEALPADQRMTWWLDHVLADRRSHDYLAERLARSAVGTEEGPFLLYRRRRFTTWLAEQVAANRPYDELVRELIAGRGLWTDHPATNFVTVTSQPDEKKNQPDPVRLAGRVTRAFLGIRLDCAQCHNHPFADWKQSDFEGLSAFFGQTHVGFTGVYDGPGEYEVEDKKTRAMKVVERRVPFAGELLPPDGARRERLAAWVTHPKNTHFARATVNRVWAIVTGRPLVEPVDNLETGSDAPAALDVLADDFAASGYDLRRLIRVIASTEVFALDSAADRPVADEDAAAWAVFPMTRLRPEQVAGAVLQAASVSTVDAESHILVRLMRYGQQNEFVQRYGDTGEDEYDHRGGTIPQRLLLMNGEMVRERLQESPLNAATRIAWLAGADDTAIDAAYLAALTRRPTSEEAAHFRGVLADRSIKRSQRVEDLFWALVNATEFYMEPLTKKKARNPNYEIRKEDGSCFGFRTSDFGFDRRTFLRTATLAGATWLTPVGQLLARAADTPKARRGPAQSVIMLWMQGGPSQLETFDPHPNTRIAAGTGAIDTAVKGVQLAPGLERLAAEMADVSLIRSMVSKEGDHERGTYTLKTGFRPDPTVVHPAVGAILCHQLPAAGTDIPRHVSILANPWSARGGYLGDKYDAFRTDDPSGPVPDTRSFLPKPRDDRRLASLDVVEKAFAKGREKRVDATLHRATIDAARTMMSSDQLKAFDVSQEPLAVRRDYGDTPFGRGCLAARRLIEVGVRCVEVTLTGWDTHANNHEFHRQQLAVLDPAYAALLRDLRSRGLLERTVVICAGEFGRTPTVNPAGGRDHWPTGFSVALSGGGLRGGQVVGATDPDGKADPVNPTSVGDLHATVLTALGIDPETLNQTPIGRTVKFAEGTPVKALLPA